MKRLLIFILSIFILNSYGQKIDTIFLNEVNISAYSPYKANYLTPITFKNLYKSEINFKNYGQEPSQILNSTPSITSFSDNGSGWGYSYFRLRGIDQTRINMTLNGVPLNEPEDQGCYFSNYPDFMESLEMLQIQRGGGLIKNGVSSFGGSINFESYIPKKFVVSSTLGFGSFNSTKLGFTFENAWKRGGFYIQFSDIQTSGYKYHSGNHGRSLFINTFFNAGKNTFKIIGFAGTQYNQLAWLGVSLDSIEKDRRINGASEKENDNFEQYNIQFHHIYNINDNSKFNYTIYYNFLKGFYTFDVNNFYEIPISGSILKYDLNANFFGGNVNYAHKIKKFDFYIGLNAYTYSRNHIGSDRGLYLYTNTGYRNEISGSFKVNYNIFKGFNLLADIQYRYTDFEYIGDVNLKKFYWNFINYNIGVDYKLTKETVIYYSCGKTNREPTRNDIFYGFDNLQSDSLGDPIYNDIQPETSFDHELGFRFLNNHINFNFNLFCMIFKNEIILNGQYGPTGLPLRNNIESSTRSGLEIDMKYKWDFGLVTNFNLTYNHSIIKQGDNNIIPILTPIWLSNVEIYYKYKWFNIGLNYRYQDWSYIDFANKNKISDFYTLNAKIGLTWRWFDFNVFINNMTDQKYFNSGQMNYDGSKPLYFVGSPINLYASLKITLQGDK